MFPYIVAYIIALLLLAIVTGNVLLCQRYSPIDGRRTALISDDRDAGHPFVTRYG